MSEAQPQRSAVGCKTLCWALFLVEDPAMGPCMGMTLGKRVLKTAGSTEQLHLQKKLYFAFKAPLETFGWGGVEIQLNSDTEWINTKREIFWSIFLGKNLDCNLHPNDYVIEFRHR